MSHKYYKISMHVDALGHMILKAPSDVTVDQLSDYAVRNFCPDTNNTEIAEVIEVVSVREIEDITLYDKPWVDIEEWTEMT